MLNKIQLVLIMIFFNVASLFSLSEISLKDGSKLTGKIISSTMSHVKVEVDDEIFTIQKDKIKSINNIPDEDIYIHLKDGTSTYGKFLFQDHAKIRIIRDNNEEQTILKEQIKYIDWGGWKKEAEQIQTGQSNNNAFESNSENLKLPDIETVYSNKEENRVDVPEKILKDNNKSVQTIAIFGEFGLGNVVGIYGAYKLGLFYIGLGSGYYFYNDKDNDTSIHVFAPALFTMLQYDYMIFRIRAGIDLITEERFGLKGESYTISPDVIFSMKSFYMGFSIPTVIGTEGVGVAFSLGLGYQLKLEF